MYSSLFIFSIIKKYISVLDFAQLTIFQIRFQGCVPLLKLWAIKSYEHALETGSFKFTSYFVTKKYFIIQDNEFHLDISSLMRPLGCIRAGAVFLQGSLLQRKS